MLTLTREYQIARKINFYRKCGLQLNQDQNTIFSLAKRPKMGLTKILTFSRCVAVRAYYKIFEQFGDTGSIRITVSYKNFIILKPLKFSKTVKKWFNSL